MYLYIYEEKKTKGPILIDTIHLVFILNDVRRVSDAQNQIPGTCI